MSSYRDPVEIEFSIYNWNLMLTLAFDSFSFKTPTYPYGMTAYKASLSLSRKNSGPRDGTLKYDYSKIKVDIYEGDTYKGTPIGSVETAAAGTIGRDDVLSMSSGQNTIIFNKKPNIYDSDLAAYKNISIKISVDDEKGGYTGLNGKRTSPNNVYFPPMPTAATAVLGSSVSETVREDDSIDFNIVVPAAQFTYAIFLNETKYMDIKPGGEYGATFYDNQVISASIPVTSELISALNTNEFRLYIATYDNGYIVPNGSGGLSSFEFESGKLASFKLDLSGGGWTPVVHDVTYSFVELKSPDTTSPYKFVSDGTTFFRNNYNLDDRAIVHVTGYIRLEKGSISNITYDRYIGSVGTYMERGIIPQSSITPVLNNPSEYRFNFSYEPALSNEYFTGLVASIPVYFIVKASALLTSSTDFRTSPFWIYQYDGPPKLTVESIRRCDQNGNYDINQVYSSVELTPSYSKCLGKNKPIIFVAYKEYDDDDSAYTFFTLINGGDDPLSPLPNDGTSITKVIKENGSAIEFNVDNTYSFIFLGMDHLDGTSEPTPSLNNGGLVQDFLSTSFTLINFSADGTSLAFGEANGASHQYAMETNLATYITSDTVAYRGSGDTDYINIAPSIRGLANLFNTVDTYSTSSSDPNYYNKISSPGVRYCTSGTTSDFGLLFIFLANNKLMQVEINGTGIRYRFGTPSSGGEPSWGDWINCAIE